MLGRRRGRWLEEEQEEEEEEEEAVELVVTVGIVVVVVVVMLLLLPGMAAPRPLPAPFLERGLVVVVVYPDMVTSDRIGGGRQSKWKKSGLCS